MDSLKETPILKFNPNQMLEVRRSCGYEDVNKLRQDLDQLKDWLLKQDHFKVKTFDEGFLERFLICNRGSIEITKKRIDEFCTLNNLMPEILQKFDIKNEFNDLRKVYNICILPSPTVENNRVMIFQINPGKKPWSYLNFTRYMTLMFEYMLHNDYHSGFEIVNDARHLDISVISNLNPVLLNKASVLFLETLAQRMHKVHLIAGSKLLESIIGIVKLSFSSKIVHTLVLHTNIETLYEHIPKETLPKDYGGDEKTMQELSDANFEEFCTDENVARIKHLESAQTDESLRTSCTFNEVYSGMPGSFKTLCVD